MWVIMVRYYISCLGSEFNQKREKAIYEIVLYIVSRSLVVTVSLSQLMMVSCVY